MFPDRAHEGRRPSDSSRGSRTGRAARCGRGGTDPGRDHRRGRGPRRPVRAAAHHLRRLHRVGPAAGLHRGHHPRAGATPVRQHPYRELYVRTVLAAFPSAARCSWNEPISAWNLPASSCLGCPERGRGAVIVFLSSCAHHPQPSVTAAQGPESTTQTERDPRDRETCRPQQVLAAGMPVATFPRPVAGLPSSLDGATPGFRGRRT
jgi:hypothetical protein